LDLFDTSLVGLQRAMSGATLREQVLASNIANANTPGFQRSDVDFHSVLAQAFAGSATPQSLAQIVFQPQSDASQGAMQLDGNNVDINTEMADLSENTLDYQSLAAVMTTRMSILRTAIGQT
jgi:flagellar basal-body rod protein FlgB